MIITTENEAVIPINYYTTSKPTLNYQLTIINNRGYTVYYKITTPDGNLVLSGNTGSISSATTKTIMFKIYFPIPSSPQDYIVNLTVGIYSDSSYNNMIDSANFDLTVHFIDLNTVNKIAYWNFSDGTNQGWSSLGVSSTAFADPYSIYNATMVYAGTVQFTSPTITLPSTGNIWLIFAYNGGGTSSVSVSFGSASIKSINNINLDGSQWQIFAIKITQGLGNTDKFNLSFYLPSQSSCYLDDVYVVSL